MDVVLKVKNMSKLTKPTASSVILYDGKDWYVTDKEKLFSEWTSLIKQANEKLASLELQNSEFKRDVGMQLKEMTDLIHQLLEAKGDNL